MLPPGTLRACAFVGALVLASVAGVHAQGGGFTINGRVKVESGSLDGTRVVVYKDGVKQRVVTNSLSKFSIDLDLNTNYVLSFEKEGFVTKKLNFDTHAPAEAVANGFTPFEFAVSLFEQYEGVNTVVFNQPVGMIRFDKNADDFDYDTDYTKSIQSALQATLEEVAKRQEEQKGKDAAAAKEKEKQDKEHAKAEADKAKKDAELAKQQAKQQKEQEASAKKAEEDKKKAELAVKKEEPKKVAEEKPKEVTKKAEPKPEPAPVAKVKPAKKAPPRVAKSNKLHGDPHEGADERRRISANERAEASPVRPAEPNKLNEEKPDLSSPPPQVERHEELVVQPNEVITVIRLDDGKDKKEFKKVVHKYGSVFYFKNGASCSKLIYESEALAENK